MLSIFEDKSSTWERYLHLGEVYMKPHFQQLITFTISNLKSGKLVSNTNRLYGGPCHLEYQPGLQRSVAVDLVQQHRIVLHHIRPRHKATLSSDMRGNGPEK